MISKLRKYLFRKFFKKEAALSIAEDRRRIWQLLGDKGEVATIHAAGVKRAVLSIGTADLEFIVFEGE